MKTETLYRFVKASERLPGIRHNYFVKMKTPDEGRAYPSYVYHTTCLFDGTAFVDDINVVCLKYGETVIEWLEPLPQSPSTQKERENDFYPGQTYQRLFNYLYHGGLTLLQSEMQELIKIVHEDFPSPSDREAVEGYVKSVSVQNKELIEKTVESKKEIERLQASLLDVCEKSAVEVQRLKGLFLVLFSHLVAYRDPTEVTLMQLQNWFATFKTENNL